MLSAILNASHSAVVPSPRLQRSALLRFEGDNSFPDRGIDAQTLAAYQTDSALFERLDSAVMGSDILSMLERIFPLVKPLAPKPSVLDVGAGTSIHMRWLNARGYDAYGVEPWEAGIEQALKKYPYFTDKFKPGSLPDNINGFNRQFDDVFCVAVLMHLPDKALLPAVATAFKQVVKPGGRLFVSFSGDGRVLDANRRDSQGRFFLDLFPTELKSALNKEGFVLSEEGTNVDWRGVTWHNLLFEL